MKLDEIPKKNIYEVPADYFEKLPGVMMNRVTSQLGVNQGVFDTIWALSWLKSSLAGLVLITTFIFIYLVNYTNPVPNPAQSRSILAAVSNTDAIEYLLISEQLENTDLAILPQAEQDFTHEFLKAPEEEIVLAVEMADLNDITD